MVGLLALWGWRHACSAGLVSDELTQDERIKTTGSVSLEMYSAMITIPFAFTGATIWTLSWLLYPVGRWLFMRAKQIA
jgi:hypothetical protein